MMTDLAAKLVTEATITQPEDVSNQQTQQTMPSIQHSIESFLATKTQSAPPPAAQTLSYAHEELPLPVNIGLLTAVSTAIWKLAASSEAREKFRQLGILAIFVRQLNQPTEEVLLPIVSAISVIATDGDSLTLLHVEQAVPRFVWLLSVCIQTLITNNRNLCLFLKCIFLCTVQSPRSFIGCSSNNSQFNEGYNRSSNSRDGRRC